MNRLDTKEIIGILMESAFYFDLNLKERCSLIKRILDLSSHRVLISHPDRTAIMLLFNQFHAPVPGPSLFSSVVCHRG